MVYIECPQKVDTLKYKVFLAGGVSNCRQWQTEVISKLYNLDIALLNPRRKNFDVTDKDMETEQICWEHNAFKTAHLIVFYFCHETACPITLFELGKQVMVNKPIIIGMDENYSRKNDVIIQTKLERPEVPIVTGLDRFIDKITDYLSAYKIEDYE